MKYVYFLPLLTISTSLVPLGALAAQFNQESVISQIRADGIDCLSGTAEDAGFWLMSIGVSDANGRTEKQALDLARMEARANMAKSISVKVASASESFYGESDAGVKESFTKWSRTDTDELLAGVHIVKAFIEGDKAYAFALLTQNRVDATAKLKAAMKNRSPGTVEAKGDGPTRKDAIDAACRSALEQVNGVRTVASDVSVDDAVARTRVYADVQGLVSAYRIISEKQEGGMWNVVIVVTIDKDELQDSYGAQLKSIGDPLFYIEGTNDDTVKQMSDYFIAKGFKTTTNKGTSDYKIELANKSERVKHPANGREGTQLQLSAVCFDKAGVQLFSVQNDPRKAVSFVGSDNRQTQICVEKAVKQVGRPLHERIQKAIADLVNNGRTVRMVFRNVVTQDRAGLIERLVAEVNDIPGAGSATVKLNEEVKVATLRFTLKGNPQDFVDRLRKRVPDLPNALSVTTNKIVFEF